MIQIPEDEDDDFVETYYQRQARRRIQRILRRAKFWLITGLVAGVFLGGIAWLLLLGV